jgi:hypothetical protein
VSSTKEYQWEDGKMIIDTETNSSIKATLNIIEQCPVISPDFVEVIIAHAALDHRVPSCTASLLNQMEHLDIGELDVV